MKKKLIALGLSAMMLVGMGSAVFAEGENEPQYKATKVEYAVADYYEWTVTPTLTIENNSATGTVSVLSVVLEEGETLDIKMITALMHEEQSDDKFMELNNNGHKATAKVEFEDLIGINQDNLSEKGSSTLTVSKPVATGDFYSGKYEGTLTFEAEIKGTNTQNTTGGGN